MTLKTSSGNIFIDKNGIRLVDQIRESRKRKGREEREEKERERGRRRERGPYKHYHYLRSEKIEMLLS
jgi:hypothetical protein